MNPTLLQALALQNSGQAEPAADLFVALLKQEPGEAIASYSLGVIRCAQANWAEALRCLSQAISTAPGFAQAHFARSSVNEQLGDIPAALADAERAFLLDASLPGAQGIIDRLRGQLQAPAPTSAPQAEPKPPAGTTASASAEAGLPSAAPSPVLALPQDLLALMGRAEHFVRQGQPETALAE